MAHPVTKNLALPFEDARIRAFGVVGGRMNVCVDTSMRPSA
jgi:hypothetical protein